MRNLFLALVLANLGLAAWNAWFSSAQRVGRPADEGLPTLTLVSEVPADLRSSGVVVEPAALEPPAVEQPASAVPTEQPAPTLEQPGVGEPPAEQPVVAAVEEGAAAPAESCTSVGPFRELSQAATAAAALRAAGHQPLQRVAEGDIWIGYWVYIPAIATEREANEVLAQVRAEGITDSYVIPNSDSGNLVSLGVFSEISGVSRRRDQVRALGFEPEVVDRTRRATVYWNDISLGAEQTLDFVSLQTPGRIIRLEPGGCAPPPG
jgi:cell division septation protein DedD